MKTGSEGISKRSEGNIIQSESEEIIPQLNSMRRRFLESVVKVLLVLTVLGLPLSLIRILNTGLNWNHISHVCTALVVLPLFYYRKRLSDHWLLGMVLLIFAHLTMTSFLEYGIVSAGFYFATAGIFIAGTALGLRAGIISAVIHFVVISVIAYLWMTGILTFPGDVGRYILLPSVWALLAVAFIITSSVYFFSATVLFKNLRNLVTTIHSQKLEIQKQSEELTQMNKNLEDALREVRTLSGLLPICASCKKIRDDTGYWNQIEEYIIKRTDAQFTHGVCPDCAQKMLDDLEKELK